MVGNLKGIVITNDARLMLMSRYNVPIEDVEQFPLGYIMVADFGDNGEFRYEGVLTETRFNELFVKGKALMNGFFEVGAKE